MFLVHPSPLKRFAVAASAVAAALALAPAVPAAQAGSDASVQPTAQGGDDCGDPVAKPSGGTWSCTFVDDFDRRGRQGNKLDGDKWLAADTSWSGYSVGSTCVTGSNRNVSVRGGSLVLTARDEGSPFTCHSPVGDFETQYTGASIGTRGRFAQTYGRFEVRAKFPDSDVPGLHGAFWLYPEKHTYGEWPHSGEVDVAEWWSSTPTMVLPSLHYPGRGFWTDSGWWCSVADAGEFHTYAVEWTPEVMRFYQDGSQCYSRSWQPDSPLEAPQPFDHPFNIVLTMGVGGSSGNNAVTSETELPAHFEVDYVKAWR